MVDHINTIRTWIQTYVIDLNLCPFASYAFDNQKIYFKTERAADSVTQLKVFWDTITFINKSKDYTSSIIIYPFGLDNFDTYLDFYDKALWLLEDTKQEDKFQLASFHPQYKFEGEDPKAVSHFTNRSPFPLLHILSVDEVSDAIKKHGRTDQIPIDNIAKLESLGKEKITALIKKSLK